MSVHINIRIPDELATLIEKMATKKSMTQTAVIVNGLWSALGPVEVAEGHQRGGKKDASKRALGRTPKKVFGPSPIEAILPDLAIAAGVWHGAPRPAHAPGCKCLMCKGK